MDPGLIGILFFLAFGAAIAAAFRRGGMWLQRAVGMGRSMTIHCKDGRKIEIENVSVTLHGETVESMIARSAADLTPGGMTNPDELERKVDEFLDTVGDTPRARYAVNTFKAYASGIMEELIQLEDEVSLGEFDETVNEIMGPMKQDGIPHLEAQLAAALDTNPPVEDEFLLGYADRVVLTNRRVIVTSEGAQPHVEHVLALDEMRSFTST
jgi:hypothetical protein